MLCEPGFHIRMAMSSIVIEDQVNIQALGYFPVDLAEEFQNSVFLCRG